MKEFHCPHCGQTAFSTLCTDCQADGIRIQETRSIFHIGRCVRCGHVDDEPCAARIGSNRVMSRVWYKKGEALRELTQYAFGLASRAAEAIKSGTLRVR